jgi:folylpolyglutamate synthase/dihydropteroate synthase
MGSLRWTFVAGILADKRWQVMLDALLRLARRGRLCGLSTANAGRRLTDENTAAALSARSGVTWVDSVEAGIDAARADVAAGDADAILITGSFHTVGEALVALGFAAPGRPYEPSMLGLPAGAGAANGGAA